LVNIKFHIARARRSKRLARDASLEYIIPKRVRRANINTLAKFSKQQSLLRINTRPKKKPIKLIDFLKVSLKLIDIIIPFLVDLTLLSSFLILRIFFIKIINLLVQVLKNKNKISLLFDFIIE
jgi:hypothetical protein